MLTIIPDFGVTARRRYHLVVDANDVLLYSSPTLSGVLNYLWEAGHKQAYVETEDNAWTVEFTPTFKPAVPSTS